jgi:hypothetical protein
MPSNSKVRAGVVRSVGDGLRMKKGCSKVAAADELHFLRRRCDSIFMLYAYGDTETARSDSHTVFYAVVFIDAYLREPIAR